MKKLENCYKSRLNANQTFQKAFLIDLGKLNVQWSGKDEDELDATMPISDPLVEKKKIFDKDFTTTTSATWNVSYKYVAGSGLFKRAENEEFVELFDEYREVAQKLNESDDYVDSKAIEALELNCYGFSSAELKSECTIGKGKNAQQVLCWDFNKFPSVLISHLPFRTWERKVSNKKTEHDLFLYTPDKGYHSVGPDEMNKMLQAIGVSATCVKLWDKDLVNLVKNHPKIEVFYEWNTKLTACKNCVLNPWTLELRPHSPDDLASARLLANWDPSAESPLADKLFNMSDPDDAAMVKAMLAVTLVGNENSNFFIQKGVTGTGKSTVLEIWGEYILGPDLWTSFYAQRAFGESDSCRFGLKKFDTAFMAVCDDLTTQRLKESGILKTATSYDNTLSIETKGKDSYDADARAVIIINSNDVPNFEDRNGALLRRAVFIDRDAELDEGQKINFKKILSGKDEAFREAFRSRLLYLVMEQFQKMVYKADDGTWAYKLPPESKGGQAMRAIAENKGIPILAGVRSLLGQAPIIGESFKKVEKQLKDTYEDIQLIDFKSMGRDTLNNALHSIGINIKGVNKKLRLQLYGDGGSVTLIQQKGDYQKAWSVRASSVLAFSSLDADEREEFGKKALRYQQVKNGAALGKCMDIADKNYEAAQEEWDKFMEAYTFTLAKIAEFDPEAVKVYEAEEKDLDFHNPN